MENVLYGDFDCNDYEYIEGQIALREVNILLEKEDIISRINLYNEAAGGIIAGLLGFIKSAIGLILKIFIGFKGFIIALIVGFVARFIYKKMKGGVDSTGGGGGGGGGYSSTPLANTGVSAATVVPKKIVSKKQINFKGNTKFMSMLALNNIIDDVKEKKLSQIKKPLEVLMTPATAETQPTEEEIQKAIEEVSDIVSDTIVESVRVEVDTENSAAIVLPKYIDVQKLFKNIEKCIDDDTRPGGGTYSQMIQSAPFYKSVSEMAHTSFLKQYYGETASKYPFADIVSDFIINYDSAVAAALSIQIGLLNTIAKAVGNDNDINDCLKLFDELRSSVPSDALKNISELQQSMKEYDGKNLKKYMDKILYKMKHKYKPKSYEIYKNVADLLSNFANKQSETNKTLKESGIDCITLYSDDSGTLIQFNLYGSSDDIHNGVRTLKRLKDVISNSNFDINRLKDVLNKLESVGKKVQGVISSYKPADGNKSAINAEYFKKAVEFSIAIVSCSASSATIVSRFIAINNHPIFKAIQEDIVTLIRAEVSDPDIYRVAYKK